MSRRRRETGEEGCSGGMRIPEDDMDEPFDDADDVAEDREATTDLVTVAQARNMKEAQAMKSILESAEIAAFIGQAEVGAVQGADPIRGIPVLVPESMATEAEEILAEAAMDAQAEHDDGEFDEEWDMEETDNEFFDDDLDDLDEEDEDDFDDFDDEDDLGEEDDEEDEDEDDY
jgi:hypothetical protein